MTEETKSLTIANQQLTPGDWQMIMALATKAAEARVFRRTS